MDIIIKAKSYCENNKYRLTEPRLNVLKAIVESKSQISAYKILEILSYDKQIKPPTIYRAIDFWIEHKFIHKIESQNKYIACCFKHSHDGSIMIICENCGRTDETCLDNNISTKNIILTKEFKVKKWNMEIHGLCKKCNN